VRHSAGRSLVTGCGPVGETMTYNEFLKDSGYLI
jgi:hypothetical protein